MLTPRRPAPTAARLGAAALLAGALLTGCGSDDGATGASSGSGGSASGTFPEPTATGTECDYPEDTNGEAARSVEAPPTEAAYDGTVEAVIELAQGDLAVELDAAGAPCAVNSFVSLAEQGYFEDTPCHRLTTYEEAGGSLKVLQCGDPSGTGSGGPGYTFADELAGDEAYPAGTIAMANAGPDTNGSQFFLVYGDSQLPPDYAVLGTFDEAGVDLVSDIAAEGVQGGGPDGAPVAEVVVEDVRGTA